ncbi:tyrosine-type recombinase/integrase [Pengzhenrongella sicca]|uniref:Tyrosine-type recombinase/integrase family protein n=1 Tax=Pengzhenrongella sicca TaxID=2819238 RepID=A0A8A4Z9N5_9MICO|nr:tyrosine-type recombinase/integrase [Pengzhenrongella sicca]QTE28630.1 tyrosine-type recombinase/integrase family protein [Pengzhenrongella sicca]
MSGRPRTSIGTFGEIRIVDLGGRYRAETRYRDLDGRLRKVRATARSMRAVQSSIKDRLASRVGYGGGGLLSLSSPFGDLAQLWLEDLEVRDISEGTKENYRDDLRLHVLPFFASYTLGELSTGRVEVFLKSELAVSYSRAKHSKTLLSMMFAFALRHDAIPRNPLEGTSDLIRPKHVVQAMTLVQVQQIRAAVAAWRTGPGVLGPRPDGTVRDVCEVLLGTSMRPGEVLALRPVDITETRQGMVAHIQGTVVERKKTGCHRQDHPKTDASNRRIPVPEFAARVIRERLAQLTPDQSEVTIFHNRYGKVLTLHNLRRTFREVVKDAGLEGLGITPRWYRRTGATILARGIGVDAAATYLGHTSTVITEKHYIQPDAFIDQTPAIMLDRSLRPVDPDGTLLAGRVSDEEDDLLDTIDEAEGEG